MSIYIPRLFDNITKELIITTFEFQQIGKVKQVDFIEKMDKKGKTYNSAFVHFDFWYDNISANNFQQRVKDENKEARIVYDDPWYWVCLENTGKKHLPGDRKERINLKDFSNVVAFEEEKNDIKLDQEIEDKFERELLEEFGCNCSEEETIDCMLYQKLDDPINSKKEIDMNYVRQLEIINYKLIYDLYQLQGDFIMV